MIDSINQTPQWGIFDQSGNTIISADAVVGFEFINGYKISSYPQEKGAFETYNKAKIPFQTHVIFAISGTIAKKQSFFANLELAMSSLDTYVVWTPEYQYPSANVTNYEVRRDARQGAQVVLVDVSLEEVRILNSSVMSNTQSINGNAPANNGTIQPIQVPQETNLPVNVTPNFWNSVFGLPILPNSAWDNLAIGQQNTITDTGIQTNASSVLVSGPDNDGNTQAYFGYA